MAKSAPPPFRPVTDNVLNAWAWRLNEMHVLATQANEKWRARKAELLDHIARHPNAYRDDASKRDKLMYDWELNDEMDNWNWYRREELRIATRIAAEYQLRELTRDNRVRPPR